MFLLILEPFKFTAKEWVVEFFSSRSHAHVGDSFIFDCSTNDPDADVFLSRSNRANGQYENVNLATRFSVKDQKISLSNVDETDYGYYRCGATDKSSLKKQIILFLGRLIVNKNARTVMPEIFPTNATHKIETEGKDYIECRTRGAIGVEDSYLTWYREAENGVRSKIPANRVIRKEETTTTAHIDVEILVFENFQKSDVGIYVCVRKMGNNEATEKQIKIEIEGMKGFPKQ